MLNPDNVTFLWSIDPIDPWITHVKGTLQINSRATIRSKLISKGEAEERLRREIWGEIYGDLAGPIQELALSATRYAPPSAHAEVSKLVTEVEKLLGLLIFPAPAAKEQSQ